MTTPFRPVTIKDIAREAGVSVSSVSYALRGNTRIGAKTRKRIEKIAQELGYKRNPAFAALGAMAHQHATAHEGLPLGYLHQRDKNGKDSRDPIILDGLKKGCLQRGYRLEEFVLDDYASADHFLKMIVVRGISGLAIGSMLDTSIFRSDHLSRVALVSMLYYREDIPIHTIQMNRYEGARKTVLNVHQQGYRKILVTQLWHPDEMSEDDDARYGGAKAAIRQIGPIDKGWIRIVDRPDASDTAAWKDLIETHQPDAIIGFNSWDYYSILNAGYSDPTQLGFAAEEVVALQVEGLIISGAEARTEDVGIAAIEWLDQLIRMTQFGIPKEPRFLGFNPRWIEGETLPLRK